MIPDPSRCARGSLRVCPLQPLHNVNSLCPDNLDVSLGQGDHIDYSDTSAPGDDRGSYYLIRIQNGEMGWKRRSARFSLSLSSMIMTWVANHALLGLARNLKTQLDFS